LLQQIVRRAARVQARAAPPAAQGARALRVAQRKLWAGRQAARAGGRASGGAAAAGGARVRHRGFRIGTGGAGGVAPRGASGSRGAALGSARRACAAWVARMRARGVAAPDGGAAPRVSGGRRARGQRHKTSFAQRRPVRRLPQVAARRAFAKCIGSSANSGCSSDCCAGMQRSCDARLRRCSARAACQRGSAGAPPHGQRRHRTHLANAPLRFTLSAASSHSSSGGRIARVYRSIAVSNCAARRAHTREDAGGGHPIRAPQHRQRGVLRRDSARIAPRQGPRRGARALGVLAHAARAAACAPAPPAQSGTAGGCV
jgi:hypothetical protein